MRELNMQEVEQVSGAGTNWNAVGTSLGFIGISVAALPTLPLIAGASAFGAAATGVYSAWSSF
jgi:hypothetical protein